MKKNLLVTLAMVAGAGMAMADMCYTYYDTEGFDLEGPARRISANGRWVVGGDEFDETGSFIIDTTNPSEYQFTADGYLTDVDNNGMAVGCWYNKIGYAKYKEAAIFKDGVWTRLPAPEVMLENGVSIAVAISEDSKIIGGLVSCENAEPDEPGKRFPVQWKLNEATGEYEIYKVFNNLSLPGTYGFQVTDMTPDGRYICGHQALDVSDHIEVFVDTETGELMRFHDIKYQELPFTYTHPRTGEVITAYADFQLVDDIVDGFDAEVNFNGMFLYATNRYLFGCRDFVSGVTEEHTGTITTKATIYDLVEKRFIDGPTDVIYMCGDSQMLQFATNGKYYYGGVGYSISGDFETGGTHVAGVYDMDAAGKILVGSHIYATALGDILESPIVLFLDKSIASIQEIDADNCADSNVKVCGRVISVENANDVVIYALNGGTVTRAHTAEVAPGMYIVMADGNSVKVIVK